MPTTAWQVHLCTDFKSFILTATPHYRQSGKCLLSSRHKAEGWQSSGLSDIQLEYTSGKRLLHFPKQHINSSPLLSLWVLEIFKQQCSSTPSGMGMQTNKQFHFMYPYLQIKGTLAFSLRDASFFRLWNTCGFPPTHTLKKTKQKPARNQDILYSNLVQASQRKGRISFLLHLAHWRLEL